MQGKSREVVRGGFRHAYVEQLWYTYFTLAAGLVLNAQVEEAKAEIPKLRSRLSDASIRKVDAF